MTKFKLKTSWRLKDINSIKNCSNLEKLTLTIPCLLTEISLSGLLKLRKFFFDYRTGSGYSDQDMTNGCFCSSLPSSITRIHVFGNINSFKFFENCNLLEDLIFSGKNILLNDLNNFTNLTRINIESTFCEENVNLSACVKLVSLSCSGLLTMKTLSLNAPRLKYLEITCCPVIIKLPSIKISSLLEEINLNRCSLLSNIGELKNCSRLKRLSLDDCPKVESLPPLMRCINLEYVYLSIDRISNLETLFLCPELKNIVIPNHKGIFFYKEIEKLIDKCGAKIITRSRYTNLDQLQYVVELFGKIIKILH